MFRLLILAILLCVSAVSSARSVDRYVAEVDGVRIELSAPRADILRVRAGHPELPEDASWAVSKTMRSHRVAMDVTVHGGMAELRTTALIARLDQHTLALTIFDKNGHVVLADAPGAALSFNGAGFRLRKVMPQDAHYFGLGDKTGPLDRRGGAYTFWNTDAFGYTPATDPIYKSVPFVLGLQDTGRSFGLFMDNKWRGFADFGKTERDAFVLGAEGGPVDYYVMVGTGPKDIVSAYASLTGKPPLTPFWALGFQQSHWSYMTQTEAQGIADRLRADHIPADVLWLDIDYQDRNRPFTVNTKAFPDLRGLVKRLREQQMHLVVITDLHIADAPNQGYAPFDSGAAANIFLKKPDGQLFVGPVWPGPSVFPDFSRTKARDWWGTQYRDFVRDGVAGFWNDMNEPAVFDTPTKTMPLDTVHRIEEPGFVTRSATHAEMHNVYGMLNSRATYEGVLKLAPDRRPFVMTRASYAGGQRYAATWTGDNSSSWAHLNLSTTQLVSLGLSGFAYAGDDIGGFAGAPPSPELLTRWIQIGAFNPIFRDHYQKDKLPQEPWVHGPEQEAIRRRAIEERYRLMPYIYSLADENSRTGLPLMRPLFLEDPSVVGKSGTDNEFLLGRGLLVAPAPTGESPAPYEVVLPSSGWYDYWTGLRVDSARPKETPQLARLPVFVRPGTIIPKQPLVQSTMELPRGALELHVYPGPDCSGTVYLDDGESFGYMRGAYLRQTIRCDAEGLQFAAREGRYNAWWKGFRVVIHGWTGEEPTVSLSGRLVKSHVDLAAQTLTFDLPDISRATKVTVSQWRTS